MYVWCVCVSAFVFPLARERLMGEMDGGAYRALATLLLLVPEASVNLPQRTTCTLELNHPIAPSEASGVRVRRDSDVH